MRRTLMAVGLAAALAGGCGPAAMPTNNAPWPAEVDQKYEQLRDGMTPEQVAGVLGSEGTAAAADAYGVPQFHAAAKEKGQIIDEVREWQLSKSGFVRVAFRDKKVASYSLTYK